MDAFDSFNGPTLPEERPQHTAGDPDSTLVRVEQAGIAASTRGVYHFRQNHPWLYGFIAFVLGSALVAIFTMSTYKDWTFYHVNLKVAVYQIFFGGLGGGIVAVILAFAYARALRTTEPALESVGRSGI